MVRRLPQLVLTLRRRLLFRTVHSAPVVVGSDRRRCRRGADLGRQLRDLARWD